MHQNVSAGTSPVMSRFQVEMPEQMQVWKNLLLCKKGHGKPAVLHFTATHAGGDEPCGRHLAIFYTESHCELNYIENIWGSAKHFARKKCAVSSVGLRDTVPRALAFISVNQIQRLQENSSDTWMFIARN